MTVSNLEGMNLDVERYIHDHPGGVTRSDLLKEFGCRECRMKKVLSLLSRNKFVKQVSEGVYKHTNWLNKK